MLQSSCMVVILIIYYIVPVDIMFPTKTRLIFINLCVVVTRDTIEMLVEHTHRTDYLYFLYRIESHVSNLIKLSSNYVGIIVPYKFVSLFKFKSNCFLCTFSIFNEAVMVEYFANSVH